MLQQFTAVNRTTMTAIGEEVPAGGWVRALGITIEWQNGPLGSGENRKEPNGAFVETLIEIAKQRIEWYQTSCDKRFSCRENALAITKLEEALHWLEARTRRRVREQVEGTHAAEIR